MDDRYRTSTDHHNQRVVSLIREQVILINTMKSIKLSESSAFGTRPVETAFKLLDPAVYLPLVNQHDTFIVFADRLSFEVFHVQEHPLSMCKHHSRFFNTAVLEEINRNTYQVQHIVVSKKWFSCLMSLLHLSS